MRHKLFSVPVPEVENQHFLNAVGYLFILVNILLRCFPWKKITWSCDTFLYYFKSLNVDLKVWMSIYKLITSRMYFIQTYTFKKEETYWCELEGRGWTWSPGERARAHRGSDTSAPALIAVSIDRSGWRRGRVPWAQRQHTQRVITGAIYFFYYKRLCSLLKANCKGEFSLFGLLFVIWRGFGTLWIWNLVSSSTSVVSKILFFERNVLKLPRLRNF